MNDESNAEIFHKMRKKWLIDWLYYIAACVNY